MTASYSGQMGLYSRFPAELFICHALALRQAVPLEEENIQPLQAQQQESPFTLCQIDAVLENIAIYFQWEKIFALYISVNSSTATSLPEDERNWSGQPTCRWRLSALMSLSPCLPVIAGHTILGVKPYYTYLVNNHTWILGNVFFFYIYIY